MPRSGQVAVYLADGDRKIHSTSDCIDDIDDIDATIGGFTEHIVSIKMAGWLLLRAHSCKRCSRLRVGPASDDSDSDDITDINDITDTVAASGGGIVR